MASIRPRKRSDGTTAYAVLWRHAGKQQSLTFDDQAAADQALRIIDSVGGDPVRARDLLAVVNHGAAKLPTVDDTVAVHVQELTGVLAKTRADYLRLARDHITPTLGPRPVGSVDKAAVAEWINALDAAGLADKTIKNVHGFLSSVMATAVEKQWATNNPCKGRRLPRRDHGDEPQTFLTPSEWALLLSEIPAYWKPLYEFLAGTGVRWGEAVALTVGHVDLDAAIPSVTINQTDRRGVDGREIGATKTRKGRRTVSLPPQLVATLRPYVEGRGRKDRLFTSTTGLPVHSGLYGRVWQPAIERAQDPARHGKHALRRTPRVHDIRHSHASWLIAARVDLVTISRRLGHKSIQITVDLYGHLLGEQETAAADAAGRALAGVPLAG